MLTYEKLGDSYKLGFAIATVVLLAMGLLIIPFTVIADRYKIVRRIHDEDDNASNQQLSSSQDPDDANQDEAALDTIEVEEPKVETELDYLAPQYQTSFLRNLLTLRLWALVWSVFVTIGPELSITYNAAYIYGAIAREPQTDEMRVLLSVLNGSGSAIGRLMMAYLEFWSQKKKAEDRIPITFTFFIPNATVILSLILFLTLPPAVLPLSFTINSFGNGFLNSTMILISRTLYAKDQAKHYHMCFVATTFGILIFNLALYGVYYDKESKKYNVAKGKACYHRSCVRVPHIVMLVFTCTGILSILYFHLKYTFFCRRVLAERARLVEEALQQVEGEEADQMEPIKASALGEVFVADELNDSLGDRREQRQQP
ncbi:hypothetical protein AGDE_08479 [Angomonas deanei]|uniref:Nodulin-like domain-containing protein n=1 Tax=Angomonas deanei TaxID=59799 RepID=A0A7G2CT46_9TRYP|nr:hypothetical protein AGDE_08479 [Angomonas deanei]CAD2222970.1 hypothetical protein, conserved [Angomonas deanei]|eukprot:EPY32851.1 hypothetical protein AGDE_08479 [Angomonas deanei]